MKTRAVLVCLFFLCFYAFGQENDEVQLDALNMYRNGQYTDALAVTAQELEANPRNMDAYTVRGWSLLALRRYEDAVVDMNAAILVNSFDSRVVYILAEAHIALENFEQALDVGLRYLRVAPNGNDIDQIHYHMGISYAELGNLRNAEISLSAATYYNPGNAVWWEFLGQIRETLGESDRAITAYQRALEINSSSDAAREAINRLTQENAN